MAMMRIQEAREARGWTQEQLANALGTTQQSLQRWESGAVDPKSSKILAMSELLGVTVSYLLGIDPSADELSHDEHAIVSLMRHMDDAQRALLLAIAEEFARKA